MHEIDSITITVVQMISIDPTKNKWHLVYRCIVISYVIVACEMTGKTFESHSYKK